MITKEKKNCGISGTSWIVACWIIHL